MGCVQLHYNDVKMGEMASQFTSLTSVYSTVWPVNSPYKWPVTRKMFPFDDVIMSVVCCKAVCNSVRLCRRSPVAFSCRERVFLLSVSHNYAIKLILLCWLNVEIMLWKRKLCPFFTRSHRNQFWWLINNKKDHYDNKTWYYLHNE